MRRKESDMLFYVIVACIVIPYLLCACMVWYSFGYITYVHMLRLGMTLCEKVWIVKVCAVDIGFIVGAIMVALTNVGIFIAVGNRSEKKGEGE